MVWLLLRVYFVLRASVSYRIHYFSHLLPPIFSNLIPQAHISESCFTNFFLQTHAPTSPLQFDEYIFPYPLKYLSIVTNANLHNSIHSIVETTMLHNASIRFHQQYLRESSFFLHKKVPHAHDAMDPVPYYPPAEW